MTPNHIELQLDHSQTAILDYETFQLFQKYGKKLTITGRRNQPRPCWSLSFCTTKAQRSTLGRWINHTPEGFETRFIDGNSLHNCKLNLEAIPKGDGRRSHDKNNQTTRTTSVKTPDSTVSPPVFGKSLEDDPLELWRFSTPDKPPPVRIRLEYGYDYYPYESFAD